MSFIIRQELDLDNETVEELVEKAFENAEFSDHTEHKLVKRLRESEAFIPELALVAEKDRKIAGHILFTKANISDGENRVEVLALAPLSVDPEYQNQGIGGDLIKKAFEKAKELGHKAIIVLGHNKYYSKFGFKPASTWGIRAPFEVPDENFMAIELSEGALSNSQGIVVYAKEFFE